MLTGRALIEDVDACQLKHGQCAFWWLGQHSFIVKLGTSVCYLDPFLSALKSRTVAPLLNAMELTNATAVLGSHDHIDHIDRPVWPQIAAACPEAQFVVPKLLRQKLIAELKLDAQRVLGVDEGSKVQIGVVSITGVPAAHEFLDIDPATGLHPYLGFVLEGNGVCVYHAGDTCIYEGMQAILRRWSFDLAFLPINGRDARRLASNCIGNMTFQEAVDLAGSIKPLLSVPAHFEMFKNNSEDPQKFADYMRVKYPALRSLIPQHGQRTMVDGRALGGADPSPGR